MRKNSPISSSISIFRSLFPLLVLLFVQAVSNAQAIDLTGDWVGYFPDGTRSPYVWRGSQTVGSFNFLDVGAGTNTSFRGQVSGNTITDSNNKTGKFSANNTQIKWSDGVIWKKQASSLFPDGTKINLISDNGYRMTRCNGCQDTLNDSLPDTIILGADGSTQFSTFVVKNDPATGKVMLEADNGKKFTYCYGCITGGALYKEQLVLEVSDSNYAYNKFELAKLSNGKYTLKAPNGKYLARCDGCSPSLQRRTKSYNGNVVMAHISSPDSIYAQWTITLPGDTDPLPKDGFSMIFASDPQYGFCDPPQCSKSNSEDERLKRSLVLNTSHLKSIKDHAASLDQFRGVVVNGDMTNTMRDDQRDYFWQNYILGIKTYPGLGNHDYVNGLGSYADSRLPLMIDKFSQWVNEIPETQDFDWKRSGNGYTGSLSYWWDIGKYRFVQLNMHPAYSANTTLGGNVYNFNQSMDWLDGVLNKSRDKTVILNMHGFNTKDSFSADSPNFSWGYPFLQNMLDRHPHVAVIFAGHIHYWAGDKTYYADGSNTTQATGYKNDFASFKTKKQREIPVLFNGSAIYNLYLSVRFERNKITWKVIDSRNGGIVVLDTGSVQVP